LASSVTARITAPAPWNGVMVTIVPKWSRARSQKPGSVGRGAHRDREPAFQGQHRAMISCQMRTIAGRGNSPPVAADQPPQDLGFALRSPHARSPALGGRNLPGQRRALDDEIMDPIVDAVDLLAQFVEGDLARHDPVRRSGGGGLARRRGQPGGEAR